jgi:uncharacterized protein (DUF488 family)
MLYTIGYESKSIDDLISQLKNHNVATLVDVREIPISRKKGFSKTVFSEYLNKNGIEYIHLKKLGSPKNLRKELKKNKDYRSFFDKYLEYVRLHKDVIYNLYKIILEKNCCIMCYEDLPSKCHRKIICGEIEKIDGNGLEIEHL